ncbi:serine/threonine protein kinase [Tahibacter amnicola]|uniref:Stress response kinase A n=1 Tax=Tahibacter amnicola TaxID=2976241 RepID=A0ABY6BFD6_9GAMM|nr:serine/threonine protein kinase [Tahibacter amnicola]UXI68311.1 serine/threonine protein kinase [Tahibacter amnicola]
MSVEAPYEQLSPQRVLAAVEALGLFTDGRLLALNSFENRVYQVGIEDAAPVVAKFYRPGRWTDSAIAEEHAFAAELVAAELPIVAPLSIEGRTLHHVEGFRVALYPRRGGRAPLLESADHLAWMGRLIARIHSVGARGAFRHRGAIDLNTFHRDAAAAVEGSGLLPPGLERRYRSVINALAAPLAAVFAAVEPRTLRLHADCHPGNVLWTDDGPHFVDLDDARMGPAVQDLWMLAADRRSLDLLLEGYVEFRDFDPAELALIEPLRLLRQIHWAGWIAARWHDPAFPAAFAFVGEARWWEQHVNDLQDAAARMTDSE